MGLWGQVLLKSMKLEWFILSQVIDHWDKWNSLAGGSVLLVNFPPLVIVFSTTFAPHFALTGFHFICTKSSVWLAYLHVNNVEHHVVSFQGRHWIPFNAHFLSDSRHWINHVCHALFMTTYEIPNHFSSHVSITLRPCPLFITNTQSCDWLICHSLTAVSVPIDLISNQLACYYWK